MDVQRWWARARKSNRWWFRFALSRCLCPNDDPKVINVVQCGGGEGLATWAHRKSTASTRPEPGQQNWLMVIGCGTTVFPIRAGATSYRTLNG